METNTLPRMDTAPEPTGRCPRFEPSGRDGRHLRFDDAPIAHATTRSLLHVPPDMGRIFARAPAAIEAADAPDRDDGPVPSRALSATRGEHLSPVTHDLPGEEMTRLTGTFPTRAFAGPYRKAKDWAHDMEVATRVDGDAPGRAFVSHATCPRCAHAHGENDVVDFVEIAPLTGAGEAS